ncbi:MAG: GNAT family N-acetyltransferase [Bacteroidales bacterium]|nr:GNAT family N-acetyltransferase [Bacteroidales bacterium]
MVEFVKFDEKFLELSWIWLNDLEIKVLTNTPDFTQIDQRRWFESLDSKKDYEIWGVTVSGIPIGVCGLKNIKNSEAEYWGYIGDKLYWRKGIGEIMMKHIITICKKRELSVLKLFVLENNIAAINLYSKTGFQKQLAVNGLLEMIKIL